MSSKALRVMYAPVEVYLNDFLWGWRGLLVVMIGEIFKMCTVEEISSRMWQ